MLWDVVFLVVASVLAANGWKRGLKASWRGPIAMIMATAIVQQLYIDFSTWIMSRLLISPVTAVIAGYLMLWFCIEALLEILLSMIVRAGVQIRPVFLDKVGGAIYGLVKAIVIVILPLTAVSVDLKIPPPPADQTGLVLPDFASAEGSYLIGGFRSVASALVPVIGSCVVSNRAPSFTPVYPAARPKAEVTDSEDQAQARWRKDLEDLLK